MCPVKGPEPFSFPEMWDVACQRMRTRLWSLQAQGENCEQRNSSDFWGFSFLADNDLICLHEVRRDFVCSKYRCCSVLWHHLLFTGSASFNPGWAQFLPLCLSAGGHLFPTLHPAWKTSLRRDSPSFPSGIGGWPRCPDEYLCSKVPPQWQLLRSELCTSSEYSSH